MVVTTGGVGLAQTGPTAAGGQGQLAQASPAGRIADVRIDGMQRIDASTVRSYLRLGPGDPFDAARIDESLKALFDTNLFADVTIRRDGDSLVVTVVENPIINRIAFEGNRRLTEEQLTSEVQTRARTVYTRSRVQSDVQRILDLYRRNGRFAAAVEPKIIQLDQNRVDLVFEIAEGDRTGVNRISFVGNQVYGDGTLRDVILTRETAWWRFLSSSDSYDPDRLNADRELLRRFYLTRGYPEFRVVSAVAELAPDRSGFFITFTVSEGERYKFGKLDVTTSLTNFDPAELRSTLAMSEGDWYDANAIETTITNITNAMADRQFAFVDVQPRIVRNPQTLTYDVVFDVSEGPRVFVERINIVGNQRTVDRVIRREMQLVEGDPFSISRLRRSEQRIRNLDFFERVDVRRSQGSGPDQTQIDVEVAERATGEISFGIGFSTTDGPLGDISLSERNLLGTGKQGRVGFTLLGSGTRAVFSYTDPYFLERDLSAGTDLFYTTRSYSDDSYKVQELGSNLRMGYPLSEYLRQRVYYQIKQTEITDVDSRASRIVRDQQGSRVTSLVGQQLTYDRRDDPRDPTSGYVLRLTTDIAGLGGDAKFLRGNLAGDYYFPVSDGWVVRVGGEYGRIEGLGEPVSIADRYFLGGEDLRGFRRAGVGPRDVTNGINDALGGTELYRGTVELTFPLGLPTELGIRGSAFTDFGTLKDMDATPRRGETFQDTGSIRVSAGLGVSWRSPLGPIRLDFARAIKKEDFDRTEFFRFSLGARF